MASLSAPTWTNNGGVQETVLEPGQRRIGQDQRQHGCAEQQESAGRLKPQQLAYRGQRHVGPLLVRAAKLSSERIVKCMPKYNGFNPLSGDKHKGLVASQVRRITAMLHCNIDGGALASPPHLGVGRSNEAVRPGR